LKLTRQLLLVMLRLMEPK